MNCNDQSANFNTFWPNNCEFMFQKISTADEIAPFSQNKIVKFNSLRRMSQADKKSKNDLSKLNNINLLLATWIISVSMTWWEIPRSWVIPQLLILVPMVPACLDSYD